MQELLGIVREADASRSREDGSENLLGGENFLGSELTTRMCASGNRCNHRQSTAVSKISSDSDIMGETQMTQFSGEELALMPLYIVLLFNIAHGVQ